jgi:hypothetical protein
LKFNPTEREMKKYLTEFGGDNDFYSKKVVY